MDTRSEGESPRTRARLLPRATIDKSRFEGTEVRQLVGRGRRPAVVATNCRFPFTCRVDDAFAVGAERGLPLMPRVVLEHSQDLAGIKRNEGERWPLGFEIVDPITTVFPSRAISKPVSKSAKSFVNRSADLVDGHLSYRRERLYRYKRRFCHPGSTWETYLSAFGEAVQSVAIRLTRQMFSKSSTGAQKQGGRRCSR